MLLKTEGIVLHSLKYSDTSLICKIYTRELGLVSYIIKGIRSGKGKAGLLTAPNILDLVVYQKEGKNLQNIKEFRSSHIFTQLPFDIVKSCIAMFLIELLNRCIVEEEPNQPKFEFIKQSFVFLDTSSGGLSLFPAWYMIHFAAFLGFEPGRNYNSSRFFDLRDGIFINEEPEHSYFISGVEVKILSELVECEVEDISNVHADKSERKRLILQLMHYYQYHIEGFGTLKSFEVLENVLQ